MKLNTKHFKYLVFIILILYGLNNFIFERQFFFNEILSLIGLGLFLRYSLKKKIILSLPKSTIIKLLLFFWSVFIFYALTSIFFKTEWYFYFRHLSIWYSSFIFFIGFYWKDDFQRFLSKIRYALILLFLIFIPTPKPYYAGRFLDRYSVSVFFPFTFRKISYWLLLIANFLYAYFFDSLTGIVLSFLIFFILILKHYAQFQLLFIAGLIAFASLFIYLSPYFAKYKEGATGNHLFGNLHYVYSHSKILQIDPNTSWRMVYWYRIIVEKFPQNIVGIGIGTPYLPYIEGKDTTESNHDDKHDAHNTGSHNTYITLFARFGVSILLFFYLLYTHILKDFYRYKTYYLQTNQIAFFIGFFTISVIGLFNPLLETPTYSGLFWFFLGTVAKVIFERKFYENPANS